MRSACCSRWAFCAKPVPERRRKADHAASTRKIGYNMLISHSRFCATRQRLFLAHRSFLTAPVTPGTEGRNKFLSVRASLQLRFARDAMISDLLPQSLPMSHAREEIKRLLRESSLIRVVEVYDHSGTALGWILRETPRLSVPAWPSEEPVGRTAVAPAALGAYRARPVTGLQPTVSLRAVRNLTRSESTASLAVEDSPA